MQAFGYGRLSDESEHPLDLREVSLALTIEEIDGIIAFLTHVKEQFAKRKGKPVEKQTPERYSAWSKTWNETESDLIVVYTEQR